MNAYVDIDIIHFLCRERLSHFSHHTTKGLQVHHSLWADQNSCKEEPVQSAYLHLLLSQQRCELVKEDRLLNLCHVTLQSLVHPSAELALVMLADMPLTSCRHSKSAS